MSRVNIYLEDGFNAKNYVYISLISPTGNWYSLNNIKYGAVRQHQQPFTIITFCYILKTVTQCYPYLA